MTKKAKDDIKATQSKMISPDELDTVIAAEVEKERDKLKAEMRAEIEQEVRDKIKSDREKKQNDALLARCDDFLDNTGMTDREFAKRLMKMNVQKQWISVLRNDHKNLSDKQIWAYIRANWRAPKVK